jgi:hypothetical protein
MPGVCENFGSGSNNAPAWIGSIVKRRGFILHNRAVDLNGRRADRLQGTPRGPQIKRQPLWLPIRRREYRQRSLAALDPRRATFSGAGCDRAAPRPTDAITTSPSDSPNPNRVQHKDSRHSRSTVIDNNHHSRRNRSRHSCSHNRRIRHSRRGHSRHRPSTGRNYPTRNNIGLVATDPLWPPRHAIRSAPQR